MNALVRSLAAGGLALALLPGSSGAAEPRPISIQEAVEMARKNAVVVVQAQGQRRTASAAVRSAYASFLPSVSLSAGATRQLPAGSRTRIENGQVVTLPEEAWSYSAGLGASVDLFQGGRRFLDVREARARAHAAGANLTAGGFEAALQAKQEYFNVLAARESQVAAAAQLEQAEQQLKTAVARVRAREATRSDSLRADILVRNARLAIADAAQALALANASLTRATGSEEPVTAAADSLDPLTLALGEEELRERVRRGPAVAQPAALADAARAASLASWTEYLPSLSLSYSRSGSGASEDFALANDLSYSGALRFSLSMPLFNQFQREQRTVEARVSSENAQASLRDARLAAEEALIRWLGEFRTSGDRVNSQLASIEAAQEDLRLQQRRYAVGSATLLDVLTSQTQLDQARRDLIRARLDQRVAKAQLEALAGQDL